jgi:hypothetical protein
MSRQRVDGLTPENRAEEALNQSLNEQIAALAHALWNERGCPEGSPEEDWFKAEQEIRKQQNAEVVTLVRSAAGIRVED